jgi:transposase
MNTFLEQFAKQIEPDVHVVMIWDQAGFHCSKQLCIPDNITILPLPPYSPELNPVENLWHYLRSHFWANRVYEDWEALVEAACYAWQNTCLCPEIIQSVCRCPYLQTRGVQS